MQGREQASFRRRIGLIGVAALTALLALGVASSAVAKKKKKKPVAITNTAVAGLSQGATTSIQANCTGKTHMTGGGFGVSPSYRPDPATITGTGLRSMTLTNNPVGTTGWTAASAAFTNPVASGGLTTYARCESNTLGRIAIVGSSSASLSAGGGQTFSLDCPPATHVISGGFSGDGPNVLNNVDGWRVIVLQSYRTGPGQWTVSGYNRSPPPANTPANLTAFAVCELDKKGSSVSEVAATVPVPQNNRATADASCTGKTHVVSGGFSILPATFPGTVPVVAVDEDQPVGNQGWHVGLSEWQGNASPASSSLTTYAYCKKDTVKKKKKKK
jgi:hypothetical protein